MGLSSSGTHPIGSLHSISQAMGLSSSGTYPIGSLHSISQAMGLSSSGTHPIGSLHRISHAMGLSSSGSGSGAGILLIESIRPAPCSGPGIPPCTQNICKAKINSTVNMICITPERRGLIENTIHLDLEIKQFSILY